MLNREFTTREKVLLFICTCLLLGAFYYEFAYVNFENAKEMYSTERVEEEMVLEEMKAVKIASMKNAIDQNKGKIHGDLGVYNKQAQEIAVMDTIFDQYATETSISWQDPELSGTIVRRNSNITFKPNNYEAFKTILKELSESPYRCLIKDVSVSFSTNNGTNDINAGLSVTFYETIDGANDLSGLQIDQNSSEYLNDVEERAHAYE